MGQPNLSFLITAGHTLGVVFREQNQINANISSLTVPFTSTGGNLGVSVKGKKRIMTIQGAMDGEGYTGSTTDDKINDFIYEMEEVVNKGGSSSFRFYDSFGNSYGVFCIDFTWTRSTSDPLRILYSLVMMQVGAIADLANE